MPSQVVSEYFRLVYKTHGAGSLDGIVYPSAANLDGSNLVLFPVPQSNDRRFDQVLFNGACVRQVANLDKVRPQSAYDWFYSDQE